MQRFFYLFISFLFLSEANACLNGDSKTLTDGTYLYADYGGRVPKGHNYNFKRFPKIINRLDSLYKATGEIEYLSDKGILLILTKEYDEAIQLYLKIEKTYPDRYPTASNIGTAYELIGDNENALKWIEKSVTLKPESHFESEWIHVNILKAKIQGDKFINSDFLLNTSFGNDLRPKSKLSILELQKLYQSLYFQLNERMSFIKPKDKIVAQLLFDLGNIELLLKNYSEAKQNYEKAILYGYKGELAQKRIHSITEISIKISKVKKHTDFSLIKSDIVFLLAGIIIVLIFILRKKIKNILQHEKNIVRP